MPADWLSSTNEVSGRLRAVSGNVLRSLGEPAKAHKLRQLLLLLLVLWGVTALASLVWALLPAEQAAQEAPLEVINPVVSQQREAPEKDVDIDRMVGWHLFGEAAAEPSATAAELELAAAQAGDRDGIEDGARETRLDLVLRGVAATSDDGLGHAIIEHKKRQQVYSVEDKLPVSGRVFLAKVMPLQVVLDNGGTYELLPLFEESELDRQLEGADLSQRKPPSAAVAQQKPRRLDTRDDTRSTELASSYRDQLYQNPQSLAQVVQVSAVRKDGELQGYRIRPGKDQAQFKQLGFKPGDLVTGVNGIALDDPANTMRLYQVMRSASEAVFDLQRGSEQLTLSVNLASDNGGE